MKYSYNWLKEFVEIKIAPEVLAEKLTQAGFEVTALHKCEGDTILEIEITPNRADSLSILGLSREIAALLEKPFHLPKAEASLSGKQAKLEVLVKDKSACPIYSARVIHNLRLKSSPGWLVKRLECLGIRSINNIVDITNYCLLELGQPLHAFDLKKISGGKIIVRRAQKGEEMVTIDGKRRSLDEQILVIADKEKPIALAGIMGSLDSEVSARTSEIVLESAFFHPLLIRRASRYLSLATEASYRFERGVDPEMVIFACQRAAHLLQEVASEGEAHLDKLVVKGKPSATPKKIALRSEKVGQVLGAQIAPLEIKQILKNLNLPARPAPARISGVKTKAKNILEVKVPSYRQDLETEIDLVEEVARIWGYEKVGLSLARTQATLEKPSLPKEKEKIIEDKAKFICVSLGLQEILSYSLISLQDLKKINLETETLLRIKNPLSYEQEILRPTLLVGLVNCISTNLNRQAASGVRIFELSRVYFKDASSLPKEELRLAIGLCASPSANWQIKPATTYTIFHLKGIIEQFLQKFTAKKVNFPRAEQPSFVSALSCLVSIEEEPIGFFGQLKPELLSGFDINQNVFLAELDFEKLTKLAETKAQYHEWGKFPRVQRDLSLVVEENIPAGAICGLIKKTAGELVKEVELLEQYFGEQIPAGKRGLTYSIIYQSAQKTLTQEEVNALQGKIIQGLQEKYACQVR
jgi:phenylalanyl-tRNA synthetase beta chain